MLPSRRLLPAFVISACLVTACQAPSATDATPAPPRSEDVGATSPQTPIAASVETSADPTDSNAVRPRTGFAPLPPGTPITYGCDDGTEVKITYRADAATITLPDGRESRLAKAQSASKGGGEVFTGDTISLMRDGPNLELHLEQVPARTCRAHQT